MSNCPRSSRAIWLDGPYRGRASPWRSALLLTLGLLTPLGLAAVGAASLTAALMGVAPDPLVLPSPCLAPVAAGVAP